MLLVSGDFDPYFTESILPYIQYHQFKDDEGNLGVVKVTLPNGI